MTIYENKENIMVNFLICLFISVSLSYGMAILLVEKGKDFPIRPWRIRLQLILSKVHWKLPQMLFCTTCTSFWTTLISDIVLCVISGGTYFFWPFSGMICAGIMWTVVEYLNTIDKDQDINVFIDRGDNDEN
jgi:hypothetical protein